VQTPGVVIAAAHVPSHGWGEIGAGLIVIGAVAVIYLMNRTLGRQIGKWPGSLMVSNRIGAALFCALGLFEVARGIVHLF
jgi:hypothetical protein